MPEESQDVNTEAASSADSTQTVESPAQGLEKVISDTFKASSQEAEPTVDPDGDKPATDATQETETKSETKVESEPKAETKTETSKEDSKGPVPYERFQEVNQKKSEFESRLQQVEPLAQAHQSVIDHCRTNNIAPEEFQFWMNVAAMAKNDPTKALEMLKPSLVQWQNMSGDVLPSDLQKAVDAGEMSLDYAKRLAAAEGRQKVAQQQMQQAQQAAIEQQKQQYVHALTNALNSWSNAKIASDPEFAPKANESLPDGKYELFLRRFESDAKASNIRTTQEMIDVAEKSYAAIGQTVSRFAPKPANGKVHLRTSQSTTVPLAPPKTVEEAISRRAKEKHGIEFAYRQ